MKGTTTMVSRGMNQEHDATECPCCRLRAALAQVLLDPDNDALEDVYEKLLDAVESARAVSREYFFAESDDSLMVRGATHRYAVDLVQLVHLILDAGGEHLTVNQSQG